MKGLFKITYLLMVVLLFLFAAVKLFSADPVFTTRGRQAGNTDKDKRSQGQRVETSRGGRDRNWGSFDFRGRRFYHHNGIFFNRVGVNFIVSEPPLGAIVPFLPFGCVTFNYGPSLVFYYLDGVYYRPVSDGYLIVPEEEVTAAKEQNEQPTYEMSITTSEAVNAATGDYMVNVPNKDGSYTPVKLRKTTDGYLGPQGEFYKDNPSIEQLKVLYGK